VFLCLCASICASVCVHVVVSRSYVPMDEGLDKPKWRLVPVQGNMNELFEGEEVLAESSDKEEDEELAKKPLYIYESWVQEAARKKVRAHFFNHQRCPMCGSV